MVLILLLGLPHFADALKCYGANAFEWKARGLPECWDQFNTSESLPDCWSQCGGVAYATGENPKGVELCPYRRFNENKVTTLMEKASEFADVNLRSCQCDKWREPLPGNACPSCDDFDKIPPLILSHYDDATHDNRALLGECPPDYDACFNFCVEDTEWVNKPGVLWGTSRVLGHLDRHCFYGCAKSSNAQVLELMISTKLAELDYLFR